MLFIAVEPCRGCVLALPQSFGLAPVIDDDQGIAKRGDLVFLLARGIGADRVDVRSGTKPVPSEHRDPGRGGRDDDVSIPCCLFNRSRRSARDALIG